MFTHLPFSSIPLGLLLLGLSGFYIYHEHKFKLPKSFAARVNIAFAAMLILSYILQP